MYSICIKSTVLQRYKVLNSIGLNFHVYPTFYVSYLTVSYLNIIFPFKFAKIKIKMRAKKCRILSANYNVPSTYVSHSLTNSCLCSIFNASSQCYLVYTLEYYDVTAAFLSLSYSPSLMVMTSIFFKSSTIFVETISGS